MIVPVGDKVLRKYTTIPTVTGQPPYAYKYYNGSGVLQSTTPWTAGSLAKSSGFSEIAYTNRRKGSTSIHSNFCIHRRNSFIYTGDFATNQIIQDTSHPPPRYYYEYWNGHYWSSICHTQSVTAARAALGVATGTGFSGGNAQAWINSAWQSSKPDLAKVDVVNFSLQVGDLQALYFAWERSASLVKNIAGNFLAFKFGLAPDIGDFQKAAGGLLDFMLTIQAFKAHLGQSQLARVTLINDKIFKTGSVSPATYVNGYWNATLNRKAVAYIKYTPQLIADLGATDEALRGLMSTIGLELNPRIAWDAIPFTFVIDWFFNVGKVLERFKLPALELPVLVTDSFIQYKEELQIESNTVLDINNPSVFNTTSWPASITRERLFHRMPILPDFSVLTGLGYRTPTTSQAVLGLALATVLGVK